MFRSDQIGAAPLVFRTQEVPVPELPDAWFDGDKVITVRQLSGNELAMVQGAEQSRDLRAALGEAIASGSLPEIVAATRNATGRGDEIVPVYARKLETVRLGVVSDPPLDDSQVVEIGEKYAVTLDRLYLTISALTGKGAEAAKKPAASTPTPASKPA